MKPADELQEALEQWDEERRLRIKAENERDGWCDQAQEIAASNAEHIKNYKALEAIVKGLRQENAELQQRLHNVALAWPQTGQRK